VVFFGSQSGTAEGFAARLGRELQQRFRLETLVADLSDFDPETIAEIPRTKIAIFLLATYGDGDPSDNASELWDWLQRNQNQNHEGHSRLFASLRYAAFGLGNSHYQYYNRVVKVVDSALQERGAERLMATGKADDALGTTEEDFIAWKDDLFNLLTTSLGFEEHEVKYDPVVSVIPDDSLDLSDLYIDEPVHHDSGSSSKTHTSSSAICALPVRCARQLFSGKTLSDTGGKKGCLHIELDLANQPQIRYKTGDHLAIWPTNPSNEVERLLSMLGSSGEGMRHHPLLVKALDPTMKVNVPTPTTLDALLRHYLEICGPVPRETIRALAEFAPTASSRDFLLNISRSKDEYAAFRATTHVNLGRLLEYALSDKASAGNGEKEAQHSNWSGLPLTFLVEALPRMQPRYYSISSSSVVAPRLPSITVGISQTELASTAQPTVVIPGLATNYLSDKTLLLGKENVTVFAHVRRSKFKLPALASTPLVMVAAGTGLAPFRAFIEERLRLQSIGGADGNKSIGQMILFFGCRSPEEDYIYHDELLEMQRQLGEKLKIVTAFSRYDPEEEGKKVYVQDRVRENAETVGKMLFDGASFYVCGRASMACEVGKVLSSAAATQKGWDAEQTKYWAEGLKRNRKWQEDVWG
jgi:NADPH-ferrihemoprotein reductase